MDHRWIVTGTVSGQACRATLDLLRDLGAIPAGIRIPRGPLPTLLRRLVVDLGVLALWVEMRPRVHGQKGTRCMWCLGLPTDLAYVHGSAARNAVNPTGRRRGLWAQMTCDVQVFLTLVEASGLRKRQSINDSLYIDGAQSLRQVLSADRTRSRFDTNLPWTRGFPEDSMPPYVEASVALHRTSRSTTSSPACPAPQSACPRSP